ncbi:TPA: hypothetical protein DCL30_02435 [Candidatus Peribacteria bacterium]|nr:MAG: hypothetical protein A3J91_04315 [Candidatus Peribacteria bacterium RIFOXYC2_FULL_58_10]OGJ85109.1 MAG: hypothetical protein A2529_01410 [Candidatus Peribacteria bacterium RIFOXYD2_FULL_58_15]HAI98380.1 hypothetical protein [Candidatus Peribacteria bacterium]HAS33801.1 hypothetical protein [Candidatus Peribacteria bacterium]
MPKTPSISKEDTLIRSVERLTATLQQTSHAHTATHGTLRRLGISFMQGMAYAFGAIAAVAIAIPLIIELLRSVEWIPILGDFLTKLVTWIEAAKVIR